MEIQKPEYKIGNFVVYREGQDYMQGKILGAEFTSEKDSWDYLVFAWYGNLEGGGNADNQWINEERILMKL